MLPNVCMHHSLERVIVGKLRLILAMSVVIVHTSPLFGLTLVGGRGAVECFFVISGFYMSLVMRTKYGIVVAGGQEKLKGKIVRIGHLGYIDALDTLGAIAALEMALAEMGAPIHLGAGVSAAQAVILRK